MIGRGPLKANEIVQVTIGAEHNEVFLRRAMILKIPAKPGYLWGFKNLDNAMEVWTNEPVTITRYDNGPMKREGYYPNNRALVTISASLSRGAGCRTK